MLLHVDGPNSWSCRDLKPEHFVGLVYVQLLNSIYDTTDSHWIGAVHASAVSSGNDAILLTAPSGGGKSTFAAMLMNQGYQVLSDDFSPICLMQGRVYPFPEGISIKNRSLQLLRPFFPSLGEISNSPRETIREFFLPLAFGDLPAPAPIKGIVFLQYDTSVEFVLKRVPNLKVMDRFLQQCWLVPTEEAAGRWMEWYLGLACYTLNYSATMKAIDCISKLIKQ